MFCSARDTLRVFILIQPNLAWLAVYIILFIQEEAYTNHNWDGNDMFFFKEYGAEQQK